MTFTQQQEMELKQYGWRRHKFRKSYLIDEGWLDILDENGDVVMPNALMVHSNGHILYGPVQNPLWATDLTTGRRKWPFVAGSPITHPGRFEGRGIVEQDAPLAHLFSNVFMLWADGLNWVVNKPTEVQQDILVDWEDLDHYPGKLWVKRGEGQALRPAEVGTMDTSAVLAALGYIDQQRQNSNFVTDFAIGLPGSRTDITKGEVQIKTAQSMAIFESMGKNLEHVGKETLELVYDTVLQFFDPTKEPSISEAIGPEAVQAFASLPLEQRIEALQGDFNFTFTGVSQAMTKADQLQKMLQFATLAASPVYAGRVDPGQMIRVISDLLGVSDRITVQDPPPAPGMTPGLPGIGATSPGTPGSAPTGIPGVQTHNTPPQPQINASGG